MSLVTDTRAVSTTVGYTLAIAITAILISGLLIAGGSFVEDQRETVLQTELRVIGQQISADIEQADRLVGASSGSSVTVTIEKQFPDRIAGSPYTVSLTSGSPHELRLRSTSPEVVVTVSLTTHFAGVADSSVNGGIVVIDYDGSDLVIDDG